MGLDSRVNLDIAACLGWREGVVDCSSAKPHGHHKDIGIGGH